MSEKYFYMVRNVKDALEEGAFYTFSELTDATNEETRDFLLANNIAIEANYLPEDARRPAAKENTPEAPVKRGRGRPRKDSYQTRDMKAVR